MVKARKCAVLPLNIALVQIPLILRNYFISEVCQQCLQKCQEVQCVLEVVHLRTEKECLDTCIINSLLVITEVILILGRYR